MLNIMVENSGTSHVGILNGGGASNQNEEDKMILQRPRERERKYISVI